MHSVIMVQGAEQDSVKQFADKQPAVYSFAAVTASTLQSQKTKQGKEIRPAERVEAMRTPRSSQRTLLVQKAVSHVLKRFPSMKVRMRAGLFWYYLEENDFIGKKSEVASKVKGIDLKVWECLSKEITDENVDQNLDLLLDWCSNVLKRTSGY